ncbi:metallophosphoesterase family protein [candidate division KSB1 bacterium]
MKYFNKRSNSGFFGLSVFVLVFFTAAVFCGGSGYDFSFVFIHLQPEKNAVAGFNQAIDNVNRLNPDFIITGGDLVMDALGQKFEKADQLYNLFIENSKNFKAPVYNTMGNHEVFGLYERSGIDPSHPEYAKKMFKNRLGNGKTYYSFDHKGWHFIILDSVGETEERRYYGWVGEEQFNWIKNDIQKLSKDTPVAVSTHIPFFTVMTQIERGSLEPNGRGGVINNSKEVYELFKEHNLKLVLQGHLHAYEDIYVNGVHFITGGAVSSAWWDGPNNGLEEGFLHVKVNDGDFDTEYIDYGWEVKN